MDEITPASTLERQDSTGVMSGTIQSEADIRAFLPSKQHSLKRTISNEGTTLRKRKSKRGVSVKTLHPPSRSHSRRSYGAHYVDAADGDESEESELDEEERWQRLQQIRSLTSSLSTKRQARSQIPSAKKSSGVGKLKLQQSKSWLRVKKRYREALVDWEVWKGAFKEIEGHFGSAVVAYFRFLKWLFWLNLLLAIMLLGLIMLPQELMEPQHFQDTVDNFTDSEFVLEAIRSSEVYEEYLANRANGITDQVLDFFQGTGWMESSVLFYGYYFNKTFYWNSAVDSATNYNMPLGYLLAIIAYLVCSLLAMVHYTAHGVKDNLVNQGDKFYQACNKVFCGWDYNLATLEAAELTQKRLAREYRTDLAEQRRKEKLDNLKWYQRLGIILVRLVINLFVFVILGLALYLIFYASEQTLTLLDRPDVEDIDILILFVQFLPSITITGLNIIVPVFFNGIVRLEKYSPDTELKVDIFRSVLLRLASVVVLVWTLSSQVSGCTDTGLGIAVNDTWMCPDTIICCCWETYVGQQFYKLVLLDFIVVLAVTFLLEFPRKLLVSHLGDEYAIIKRIGQQEFQIPKNVLDLVYSQTLCWIGAVFSPLIPAITVTKFLIYFYIKKLTLLHNCIPSSRPYRASRSNSFFMAVLLASFILCGVPVVYTITNVTPSTSCGPFRVHSDSSYMMWSALTDSLDLVPSWLKSVLQHVNSLAVYLPAAIILILIIYYQYAVSSGFRRKIEQQKAQLASEGKDKQFLLNQVRLTLVQNQAT